MKSSLVKFKPIFKSLATSDTDKFTKGLSSFLTASMIISSFKSCLLFSFVSISREVTTQIIGFISNYENGAIEYENGNVILSCNMAAIREDEANIYIEYSTRANNMKLRNEYLERLEKLVKKYELKIIWSQELKE